jgi:hypothetical protein
MFTFQPLANAVALNFSKYIRKSPSSKLSGLHTETTPLLVVQIPEEEMPLHVLPLVPPLTKMLTVLKTVVLDAFLHDLAFCDPGHGTR